MLTKLYLGDSVYVDYDGFALVLTTENGGDPSNTIVLEPSVLENLRKYAGRIQMASETEKDWSRWNQER